MLLWDGSCIKSLWEPDCLIVQIADDDESLGDHLAVGSGFTFDQSGGHVRSRESVQ